MFIIRFIEGQKDTCEMTTATPQAPGLPWAPTLGWMKMPLGVLLDRALHPQAFTCDDLTVTRRQFRGVKQHVQGHGALRQGQGQCTSWAPPPIAHLAGVCPEPVSASTSNPPLALTLPSMAGDTLSTTPPQPVHEHPRPWPRCSTGGGSCLILCLPGLLSKLPIVVTTKRYKVIPLFDVCVLRSQVTEARQVPSQSPGPFGK